MIGTVLLIFLVWDDEEWFFIALVLAPQVMWLEKQGVPVLRLLEIAIEHRVVTVIATLAGLAVLASARKLRKKLPQ